MYAQAESPLKKENGRSYDTHSKRYVRKVHFLPKPAPVSRSSNRREMNKTITNFRSSNLI